MQKKKKNIIIGIVIVVALFFLIQSNFNLPFAIGSSTLSLSNVDLKSSSSFFSGKAWLLTFTSGGLGQSYFGTFSPSTIQSYTSGSDTTTKTFTLDVDYQPTTCNYNIVSTGSNKPIYDIYEIKWTYIPFIDSCDVGEANSRGMSNTLWVGKGFISFKCFAIGYNSQSPIGSIENPNSGVIYTISLSVEGGPSATKTIDTLSGSTGGYVGDFAYAQWLGNLDTGKSCTSQAPYKTAYVNGIWRIIDSQNYQNYLSKVNEDLRVLCGSGGLLDSVSDTCVDNWVSGLVSKVTLSKSSKTFGTLINQGSLNGASIKIITDTPYQNPVTSMYIKADTIGIYTPVPNIVINSVSSNCFKTGEQGLISGDIKNIGDEGGTFNAYATCDSPFQSTSNVQGSLNPGGSRIVNLPLLASVSQKTTGTCIFYVETVGGTKQKSVGVCADPQITCTPNQKFCSVSGNSDVIKQCSNDGATSSIIEICQTGDYCENAQCKSGDGGGGGKSIIDKIKDFFKSLGSGIGNLFTLIKYIIIFVFVIMTLFTTRDFLTKFKDLRKSNIARWIISIIIAYLVGYFLYKFIGSFTFWLIVVGALIYNFFFSKLNIFKKLR